MAVTIIGISVLFFLGHALSWSFTKTKVPDLLVLVVLGYILGPILGVVNAHDLGKVGLVLSTTALIVILYEGGLHLSAKDLLKSSLPAAGISILGFILIAVTGTFIGYAVGFQSWPISILLGVGIGSTSSAIVIPMVKKLSISDKTKTILSLESAFTDVLTIVIFLVIVDSIVLRQFSVQELLIGIGPKTLSASLMGLSAGMGWAFIKKKFAPVMTMAFAGEAWALLTYGLIEFSGHNGAIGVLALGFILANLNLLPHWLGGLMSSTPVSHEDLSILKEVTFLLRTFFFLYLGLLVNFASWQTVGVALLITVFIFITRYLSIRLLFRPQSYSRLDAMISVAMGPRGLACAVLATIPIQKGIEGGEWLRDTLFALIPMTIALTAILVVLGENPIWRTKGKRLFLRYHEKDPDGEVC